MSEQNIYVPEECIAGLKESINSPFNFVIPYKGFKISIGIHQSYKRTGPATDGNIAVFFEDKDVTEELFSNEREEFSATAENLQAVFATISVHPKTKESS